MANCVDYCQMWETTCANQYNIFNHSSEQCQTECTYLPVNRQECTTTSVSPSFDTICNNSSSTLSNTLDCRTTLLRGMAMSPPSSVTPEQCGQASPLGTENPDMAASPTRTCSVFMQPDSLLTGIDSSVEDYCNAMLFFCPLWFKNTFIECAAIIQYMPGANSTAFAASVDQPYPLRNGSSFGTNTLACMRYRTSLVTVKNSATRCQAAGNLDGECGGNCEFLCGVLTNECLSTDYLSCMSTCSTLLIPSISSGNLVPSAKLKCRLNYAKQLASYDVSPASKQTTSKTSLCLMASPRRTEICG